MESVRSVRRSLAIAYTFNAQIHCNAFIIHWWTAILYQLHVFRLCINIATTVFFSTLPPLESTYCCSGANCILLLLLFFHCKIVDGGILLHSKLIDDNSQFAEMNCMIIVAMQRHRWWAKIIKRKQTNNSNTLQI